MPVKHLSDGNPDGTVLGQSATDLISFFNATPIVQRSGAAQTAITDSSGGTGTTISANAFKETVVIPIPLLSNLANSQTWKIALPFAFTVTAATLRAGLPVTTGSKAATLTVGINGTPVTGGVISATSAGLATTGVKMDATAITAANVGTAGQTLEFAVSSVTAFTEGNGYVEFTVTNNDKANNAKAQATLANELRASLVAFGLIKGSA